MCSLGDGNASPSIRQYDNGKTRNDYPHRNHVEKRTNPPPIVPGIMSEARWAAYSG